jgi:DNA modification methylase
MWLTHRDCEKPLFHPRGDPQPYRDPTHHRVKKQIAKGLTGAIPYNWWEINKVVGNQHGGTSEHQGWYNQIPYKLLKRIVLSTTNVGDIVLDGFAGSCSMYPVCEDFDRQSILIDLDPASQDIFDEYESPNEED